jgi:hypothetical protein
LLLVSVSILFGALCLGLIAMTIRSVWVGNWVTLEYRSYPEMHLQRTHETRFLSRHGTLSVTHIRASDDLLQLPWARHECIEWMRRAEESPAGLDWRFGSSPDRSMQTDLFTRFRFLEFTAYHQTYGGPAHTTEVWEAGIPSWLPAPLFAAMPFGVWWFTGRKRLLRRRRGLCVNCGYDLRASPGRCPECGAAV